MGADRFIARRRVAPIGRSAAQHIGRPSRPIAAPAAGTQSHQLASCSANAGRKKPNSTIPTTTQTTVPVMTAETPSASTGLELKSSTSSAGLAGVAGVTLPGYRSSVAETGGTVLA